ncbi:MAG: hypothetical protein JXR37_34370 [Kiritimatiellae bacterium]|nr:hypothetical protein [Kiritimatiellia bacterium]
MSERKAKTNRERVIACILAMGVLAAAGTPGLAEDQDPLSALEVSVDLAWDSRYVTEGRDNLDGHSLVGTTVEAAYKGLSLGVWYAATPDVEDYREFNAFAAYNVEWKGIEAYVSYNHLRFLSDEQHDNEVGAGMAFPALPGNLALGLDWYYSFESEGSFFEISLEGEYEVHDRLTLTPAGVLGFNSGYIADGHDGANNFTLSIDASTPIKDGIDLIARVAYTWGIDADPHRYPEDEFLNDFAYGGIAIRVTH